MVRPVLLFLVACFWSSGLFLSGCNVLFDHHQDRTDEDIPYGQSFQLEVGEQAILVDGTRIIFEELVSDSRCPLDVICIWQGEIQAKFLVDTGRKKIPLSFVGFVGSEDDKGLELALEDNKIATLERMEPYPVLATDNEHPPVATLRIRYINQ